MTVSDEDRQRFEEALAAALLLLYQGSRRAALAALGQLSADPALTEAEQATITAFAADRAQLVQDGINTRLADVPDGESAADVLAGISEYNRTVLQPYLLSWAHHTGLVDTYQGAPSADGKGSAADDHLWIWEQITDFEDDCTEADSISPAPLGEIQAAAGVDAPPAHERCRCSLNPT